MLTQNFSTNSKHFLIYTNSHKVNMKNDNLKALHVCEVVVIICISSKLHANKEWFKPWKKWVSNIILLLIINKLWK